MWFPLFYSPKPRRQVWILIYKKLPISFDNFACRWSKNNVRPKKSKRAGRFKTYQEFNTVFVAGSGFNHRTKLIFFSFYPKLSFTHLNNSYWKNKQTNKQKYTQQELGLDNYLLLFRIIKSQPKFSKLRVSQSNVPFSIDRRSLSGKRPNSACGKSSSCRYSFTAERSVNTNATEFVTFGFSLCRLVFFSY